jgi:hypothetical protein
MYQTSRRRVPEGRNADTFVTTSNPVYIITPSALHLVQGVQIKSGPCCNMSNLFTTCYITQLT